MRIEVELHPEVVWYLRHRCTEAEFDAFHERLHAVREQPVLNSEAMADPDVSRYMLRCFRFAGILAVFRYDPARREIRVLKCKKPRTGRKADRRRDDAGKG